MQKVNDLFRYRAGPFNSRTAGRPTFLIVPWPSGWPAWPTWSYSPGFRSVLLYRAAMLTCFLNVNVPVFGSWHRDGSRNQVARPEIASNFASEALTWAVQARSARIHVRYYSCRLAELSRGRGTGGVWAR